MTTTIHMYKHRHVFVNDDHVGKFDGGSRSFRLFPKFSDYATVIAAWFRNHHGVNPQFVVSDDEASVAPVITFPQEIIDQMTPEAGDMTPAVVTWAKTHLSEEEFQRHYRGRIDDSRIVQPEIDPFEGVEFPQFLTDSEERKLKIDRATDRPGFVVTSEELPELRGYGATPDAAVADFSDAADYAAATAPEGGAVEIEDDPEPAAAPAKKAAKKAAKKQAKSEDDPEPAAAPAKKAAKKAAKKQAKSEDAPAGE